MLMEFGVRNFFSFKEGASVSLRLDANCPESISNGRAVSPVMCVKGANGSGKTNLLRSLAFLADFIVRSFQRDPEDEILLIGFGAPQIVQTKPSVFYAIFAVEGVTYEYHLAVLPARVVSETIYRTRTKRTKVLERNGESFSLFTSEFKLLTTMKLRRNASIISQAHNHEFSELEPIYDYFRAWASNVSFRGLRESPIKLAQAAELLHRSKGLLAFTKKFIAECDTGVNDVRIVEDKDEKDGKERFFPVFTHKNAGREFFVTDITESSGTKTLFCILGLYKLCLDAGGVLIMDEFDINLHPHILPKLINLFLDPDVNKENAQLIFTTHNAEIMDMMGRYRTCLVNKEDNESYVYRLDEVPGTVIRNDRPISPAYNARKIGGVPRI